jgi:hypothetical protein
MSILLSWLGTSLFFPVILYLVVGRLPIVVICLLNVALGLAIFRYVRDAPALRAAKLRSLADALWGLWGFIGIALLFGSLDVLQGFDLRAIIVTLRRWPLLYGLLANGLLVTATIRTASALATLFPQPCLTLTERPPLP